MKKTAMIVAAIMGCAALSSCGGVGNRTTTSQGNSGTSVLGNVLGAVANGQTIGNVLGSVLGTDKPKESDLIGTWKYRQPGVAFSSENTLAKAGGEAIAAEIKEKLSNTYSKVGFSASNTYLTFNSDKTFTGELCAKENSLENSRVAVEFDNTYDHGLNPGYGVTNHFDYGEDEGWQWTQLPDNSVKEE